MADDRSKPERDGIAEILASGRAPGFVVKGGTRPTLKVNIAPPSEGIVDPKQRKAMDAALWREKRKNAAEHKARVGLSRKKDGALRHIGSVPLDVHHQLQKQYGDAFKGKERKDILKREGWLWET